MALRFISVIAVRDTSGFTMPAARTRKLSSEDSGPETKSPQSAAEAGWHK
jgi:hypothetical protein